MPDKPGAGADDWDSVETRQHILARTRGLRVVTDDNIGTRMAPALEATVDYRTIKACGKGAVELKTDLLGTERNVASCRTESRAIAEKRTVERPVILTPTGKVDEQSRLCQSYKVTPDVREIRMPDKLRAVEQLAKICGWNEPDKFEHGARAELTELLKRLREDKARSLPAFGIRLECWWARLF